MNYEIKLKAVKLVHEWYDACQEPVVMSSGSLNLLLEKLEEALTSAATPLQRPE